jgi:hypothetical protein
MGLSLAAMIVAAAGHLEPAAGALLQEVIDLAAIGIALTALLPAAAYTVTMTPADLATARRLYDQHLSVRPVVEQVRAVCRRPAAEPRRPPAGPLLVQVQKELLPHERAEEAELVPILAKALGGADPAGAISRTHAEIEHRISRLGRLLDAAAGTERTGADAVDVADLERLLYGLYAILRLHNAREEEAAFSLLPASPDTHRRRPPAPRRSCPESRSRGRG